MATIVSFSVAHENDNANRLADPENIYIGLPGFKGILKKNWLVAAILFIGWKLKI